MNKRQAKKARKKVVYPLIDEFNLISMTEEERKAAWKDFDNYVQKCYRYYHYRDKYKVARKPCFYSFPVGEAAKKHFEEMLKHMRKYEISPVTVVQDLNQLRVMYGDKWEAQFPVNKEEKHE